MIKEMRIIKLLQIVFIWTMIVDFVYFILRHLWLMSIIVKVIYGLINPTKPIIKKS